jgi:hypothetical protein
MKVPLLYLEFLQFTSGLLQAIFMAALTKLCKNLSERLATTRAL